MFSPAVSKSLFGNGLVKSIGIAGISQLLIQGVGLLSSLLIIRSLSTDQYALYTLANSILGTMLVFTDGGIGSGLLSIGGRVWEDYRKLGTVIQTGYTLRKQIAGLTGIVAVPVLVWILLTHGSSVAQCIGISGAILITYFLSLKGSIYIIAPTLHQKVRELSEINSVQAIARMLILAVSILASPLAALALAAPIIPSLWANSRFKKESEQLAVFDDAPSPEVRRELIQYIKQTMPGAVYYSLSGQLAIWLISIFGTTNSIAEIGALSRLNQVLTIFSVVFIGVIVPRFARTKAQPRQLIKIFTAILIGLSIAAGAFVAIANLFPEQILLILGSTYSHLEGALSISIISAFIGVMTTLAYSMSAARGIIVDPRITIPVIISTEVLLIMALDLSKVSNVLLISAGSGIVAFILIIANFVYKTTRMQTPY